MSRSIGCSFGAILIFNFVHDLGVIYRKTLIFTQNCIRLLRMHFFNLRVQKLLTFDYSIRYYFKLCGDVKQRTPESMFVYIRLVPTNKYFLRVVFSLAPPPSQGRNDLRYFASGRGNYLAPPINAPHTASHAVSSLFFFFVLSEFMLEDFTYGWNGWRGRG